MAQIVPYTMYRLHLGHRDFKSIYLNDHYIFLSANARKRFMVDKASGPTYLRPNMYPTKVPNSTPCDASNLPK